MTDESPQDELTSLVRGMQTAAAPLRATLNELHRSYAAQHDGTPATSIPELAQADPAWFGICVVDTAGQVYEVGTTKQAFTLQAISNPFVYGQALMDHGREHVFDRVGIEPATNIEATLLDACTRRLPNPISAPGAIATLSMIQGATASDQLHRIITAFQRYVGHEPVVSAEVFTAMRSGGHHYRGLAHLLRNCGILAEPVDATLDLFFQQQALLVTVRDLAVMAATLANGGTNPLTGEVALAADYVPDILSLLYTCGMPEVAGTWTSRVGLPAVSGMGGGVLAVVPQQAGIAVFSPPLGTDGHSVRGVAVCAELARQFRLHIFDNRPGESSLAAAMTGRAGRTNRRQG